MTADTAWHKSACILCENNCGIQIQTDGRRFAKIRGDKEHVATAGYTCNKALRLDHYQNGGVRLTTPLRREADGTFTPIDWDTAIREIVARLKTVRDTHGGESIFFYGGGGQGNHLAAPTAAPCCAPSAPATAPTRSPRRRPARASSTPTSPADTPPETSRTPKSPSSSARTPGSPTASRAPALYSRTSPRTPPAP
ncbi:molybdopterin-dependent oxidoreductase [Streptomyces altiplanensis]